MARACAFPEPGNIWDSLSELQRRIFQFNSFLLPLLVVIASCHMSYLADLPAEWLVLMLLSLFQTQSVGLLQPFSHPVSTSLWSTLFSSVYLTATWIRKCFYNCQQKSCGRKKKLEITLLSPDQEGGPCPCHMKCISESFSTWAHPCFCQGLWQALLWKYVDVI